MVEVNPRFKTTLATSTVIVLVAAFLSRDKIANMVIICDLLAFTLICGDVLLPRWSQPDLTRSFRCPGGALGTCHEDLNLHRAKIL
jgi:APA family basic amino acid/polyamine antiporter